jgi:histidyl-tRNA synthetase
MLGLDGIELDLNTLGDVAARARYRARLVGYLEKHEQDLDADSRRRLQSNPLRVLDSKNPAMQPIVEQAPRLADDLDEASLKSFDALQRILREAGVAYRLNPRLVRGLDYYNDAVYEWVSGGLGAQNAVCAGGRYDGLVEQVGGKSAPACGFAMGVERLLELMKSPVPAAVPAMDVYLVNQGSGARQPAFGAAEQLRENGLTVTLDVSDASFKSQMKKADASGARFAVIIGEDEAAAGVVSVKPLREAGEQLRAPIAEAIKLIRKR